MNELRFDAVVVGAGPSGAALAASLARRGARVLLVHRDIPAWRRLETLPPQGLELLAAMRLHDCASKWSRTRLHGAEVAWGTEEPQWQSSIARPLGGSVVVERSRFDVDMRTAARLCGAKIVETRRPPSIERTRNEMWCVSVETTRIVGTSDSLTCTTHVLVDATGVRAGVIRATGGERRVFSRELAVGLEFTGVLANTADRHVARLEACPSGWLYALPGPGGTTQVQWFTGTSNPPQSRDAESLVTRLLTESRLVMPWAEASGAVKPGRLRFVVVETGRSVPNGPPIAAVGDSAVSFDPLASQGLLAGLTAAHQVSEFLLDTHAESSLRDYWSAIARVSEGHTRTRARYRAVCARRFDTPYWSALT